MKTLILIDKIGWSYDRIASSIVKYNRNSDLKLIVEPIKKNVDHIKKIHSSFDKIFVMGWHTYDKVSFLPKDKTVIGVHSFQSWDNGKTAPKKEVLPPKKLIHFLSQFRAVNVVSERLYNLFTKCGLGVIYTPNGVDTELFFRENLPPVGKGITIGYSGSNLHDRLKGVSEYIFPAARASSAKFKSAIRSTKTYVSFNHMCSFYNSIDVYVCASSSEGMSLSILEAGACGRPIISTRVSGNTEIIKDGVNGFFVDRDVNQISKKINQLKDKTLLSEMSDNMLKSIRENWCWSKRYKKWTDFIYNN